MKQENFTVKSLEAESGQYSVVMHKDDSENLGVHPGDRMQLDFKGESLIVIVETTSSLVEKGEMGAFTKVWNDLDLEEGSKVSMELTCTPKSVDYIKRKIKGKNLEDSEIKSIIKDIVDRNLTSSEMTAFLVAQEIRGLSLEENTALTKSMVETGETIEMKKKPVMDVHSIGGIPGNKYSLLTVPIIAAAGLTIPKTSSRAITSPAGTPDIMEVLADVSFTLDEISEIVQDVGGILAWGGSVNLAPADDILVRIERPLSIDPKSQLLASVLSKKISVGSDKILIDIPTGPGAKVESDDEAEDLAHDFMSLGHRLGINVETAITYGGQPLGHSVGPGLEARESLEALKGDGPNSLIEKATCLAGILLEMGNSASYGRGKEKAEEILDSGKAYEKMKEIIEAQGGDPEVNLEDFPLGDKKEIIRAPEDGYIKRIYNSCITKIALAAGAPRDKGAGLKLLFKEGGKVEKGEPIIEVYAEHETNLDNALEIANENPPVKVESMLLKRLSGSPRPGR